MKKIVLITSLVIVSGCALPLAAQTHAETNAAYLKIVAASNNVPQLIQALPDVEKLWPQEPEAYLKSLKQAVHTLGENLSDAKAKQAFIVLFTNMMNKAYPTNEFEAANLVSLKYETILAYGNREGIANDKSQLLAIAKVLGEIRSKTIPNYNGLAMMLSIPGITQKELEENDRQNQVVYFRRQLPQMDSELSAFLFPLVQSDQPVDTNFIHQISTAAHLTDAEKQSLVH